MSFTAQVEPENEKEPLQVPVPQIDTNDLVKVKYEAVKELGQPKIVLTRQYQPSNHLLFDTLKIQLKELVSKLKEGDNPDIDQFIPVIFGVLEGSSGLVDSMLILTQHFGTGIQNLKIEDMIKERTKVINYGVDKRKIMSVCQVDKKTLQAMNGMFDIKQIKAHRKMCLGVRNYIKSWRKFKNSFQSSQDISFTSPTYKNYVEFIQEELNFNNLKISIPNAPSEQMIEEEKIVASENEMTPLKQKKPSNKKDDTASTHKNKEGENIINSSIEDEKNESKNTKTRRTKEEIQRDRLLKQQERQEKKRQKEEKQKQKLLEKQKEKQQKAEKQRQKQLEKEQQLKAKQEEKQAKEREKQLQKQAKQKQRLQKEAQKRKKQEQKEKEKKKKNNVGQSLFTWIKPKQDSNEQSHSKQDKMDEEKSMHSDDRHPEQREDEEIFNLIKDQSVTMTQCREEFFFNKMRDQGSKFEPYYVNIFTHKSRLEFTNYLVTEQRFKDYTLPHEEDEAGKYDDSSVEYQDLCGDVCNEDVDVMSAEEEEADEENSAIVPDSYFEDGELSEESKDDVVVNIDQGGQWHFSSKDDERAQTYQMFCLFEETFPLALSQPEETNQLTLVMKCQLYKQIHGYHGTKEALVKDLAVICDKVPKSYLFGMIRETTTKKGNQRLIKPQLIQFMNEQKEGFAQQLEQIKMKRDEQIKNISREKVNEKERELERLILEEAGTYYIVDLLQFLREKGYRMTKKDLNAFIDSRIGEHWDLIRQRMKKMQVKEKEKMTRFLKKDKEQEPKSNQKQESKADDQPEEPKEDQGDKMIPQ